MNTDILSNDCTLNNARVVTPTVTFTSNNLFLNKPWVTNKYEQLFSYMYSIDQIIYRHENKIELGNYWDNEVKNLIPKKNKKGFKEEIIDLIEKHKLEQFCPNLIKYLS